MARTRGRRRRSKWRLAATTSIAAGLAVLGSTQAARSMIGALAHDASALLDGRSPGARDAGALFQTKLARQHAPARAPHQRVLASERSRPPGAAVGIPEEAPPGVLGGDTPEGPSVVPQGSGAEPAGGGTQPLASTSPVPVGGQPIPGGDTPTPAVPEPDAYALLAIGIGIVGAAHRRRRGVKAEPARHPEA